MKSYLTTQFVALHALLESAAPDKPRLQPAASYSRKTQGDHLLLRSAYPWQNAPQSQWLRQAPAWVWQGTQDLIVVRFVVRAQCLGWFSLLRLSSYRNFCTSPNCSSSEFRCTILAFGRLGLSVPASLHSCETIGSTGFQIPEELESSDGYPRYRACGANTQRSTSSKRGILFSSAPLDLHLPYPSYLLLDSLL